MGIPWENASIFLQTDVIIALLNMALLGGIGGFLVFLHVRLRALKRDLHALPELSVRLSQNITQAQENLKGLKRALEEVEPTVSPLIKEGTTLAQDLDFFIHRAQKIAQKLEKMDSQKKEEDVPASASAQTPSALELEMQARTQAGAGDTSGSVPFENRLEAEPAVQVSAPVKPAAPLAEGVGISPAEEKLRARLGGGRVAKFGANRGE